MEFHIIIPARYDSTRFPGKVLKDINGKSMLQHVYERAQLSGPESIVIATDDERVAKVAQSFRAEVCMTAPEHQSGTERVAEVVQALELGDDEIVVNVQADEPLIPPQSIRELAESLAQHETVKIATLCEPITSIEELFNPNVVKVVMNQRGFALYFSRAPIPWDRDNFSDKSKIVLDNHYHRHHGLYAYRAGFLNTYVEWESCPIGQMESLEQLRVLWHGGRIHVVVSKKKLPPDVNTPEDLEKIKAIICNVNSITS